MTLSTPLPETRINLVQIVHAIMPAVGTDAVTYTFTYGSLTDVVTRTVSASVTHTLTVTYTDLSKSALVTAILVAA
jgi:hypothetical protein